MLFKAVEVSVIVTLTVAAGVFLGAAIVLFL
jgi:hypothetical protein